MSRVGPPVTGNYSAISATTTLLTGDGSLLGILITSATTGTVAISDGGTTIMAATASLTLTTPTYIPIPAQFKTNLVVTITGTVAATVFWV